MCRTRYFSVIDTSYLRAAVSKCFCKEILAGGQSIQGGSHELTEFAALRATDRPVFMSRKCFADSMHSCKVKDDARLQLNPGQFDLIVTSYILQGAWL